MTLRSKVLLACLLLLGAGGAVTVVLMRAAAHLARFETIVGDLQRDELAATRLTSSAIGMRQGARDEFDAPSPEHLAALEGARVIFRHQLGELFRATRDDDELQTEQERAIEASSLRQLGAIVDRFESATSGAALSEYTDFAAVRSTSQELLGWTTRFLEVEDQALSTRLTAASRERQRLKNTAYAVALGVPLVGIFLLVALVVPLRRGLKRIVSAARRLKAGELSSRIHAGHDELGEVATEFNAMAVELQRMRQTLEHQVTERTRELADSNRQLQLNLTRLEDTQSRLAVADRLASLGRLAAGVAHELNNPLSYVLSNLRYVSEELDGDGASPQELRGALEEAVNGAERMRTIVQDMRVMNHGNVEAHEEFDLLPVLESAATIALSNARERITFVKELRDRPRVLANAGRLGQVFLNLLVNAVQSFDGMPEGRREIYLSTEIARAGEVRVSIRDCGKGIAPEHLSKIFDPFFTTKPVGVGTGLGLSICHTIITSLGGDIEVDSKPGAGTTVTVVLPEVESARRPYERRKVA
jgi:C4-dicarboxylate-specific signal transduction histidine kinase